MVLVVEIGFIPSVSAGSLRLPSKTADHFAVSPLQNETYVSFWLTGEKGTGDSNSLHTQNRTKGDKRGTLVEPALHRTDEG